jgi:hypothetical protein
VGHLEELLGWREAVGSLSSLSEMIGG